jgi:hypothetical protein
VPPPAMMVPMTRDGTARCAAQMLRRAQVGPDGA